jgi:hypothetical protein
MGTSGRRRYTKEERAAAVADVEVQRQAAAALNAGWTRDRLIRARSACDADRRQLLLPVSDNYFCRSQPRPSAHLTAAASRTTLG